MTKLNDKEYRCDFCGQVFEFIRDNEWSEEKAQEEYKQYFPRKSVKNQEIVCDTCWQIVKPR